MRHQPPTVGTIHEAATQAASADDNRIIRSRFNRNAIGVGQSAVAATTRAVRSAAASAATNYSQEDGHKGTSIRGGPREGASTRGDGLARVTLEGSDGGSGTPNGEIDEGLDGGECTAGGGGVDGEERCGGAEGMTRGGDHGQLAGIYMLPMPSMCSVAAQTYRLQHLRSGAFPKRRPRSPISLVSNGPSNMVMKPGARCRLSAGAVKVRFDDSVITEGKITDLP